MFTIKLLLNNKGFAVGYLILAIFLTALIIEAGIKASSILSTSKFTENKVAELTAQANLIRQKITQCVVEYPEGDNGTSFFKPYPAGTNVEVSTLECPGAPAGAKNLWTGKDGVFLPIPPKGFNSWRYTNDSNGVRISIQTTNVNAYGQIMQKVASKFSSSEATYNSGVLTFYVVKP